MMENISFHLGRTLPKGLEPLAELALDLRWAWTHAGDDVWSRLDPDTWRLNKNPRLILQNVPQERLVELAADPSFLADLQRLSEMCQKDRAESGWCRLKYHRREVGLVAYFSMEYGLGEALPLYAGGLGVLAGDYLKTSSDLDVPLVGVGLLYQEGYFRQMFNGNGQQIEVYPYNDPTNLPVGYVANAWGGHQRVVLDLPGRQLNLRVWQARVGTITLYLLDSNDPLNIPPDRGITGKLYEKGSEVRLLQEIILGIGGWRLLRQLELKPEVCHLNEGHAAFAGLERLRFFTRDTGRPFPAALWAIRGGNVFTTHTAVPAGFDLFPPDLVSRYFKSYALELGISMEQLLGLGRRDPANPQEPFNMSLLALRCSGWANGVSALHAEVSRELFQHLYPRWPRGEVPVSHVTNGVHVPTWQSPTAEALWEKAAATECWIGTTEKLCAPILNLSDHDLWSFRATQRQALVGYVRQRLTYQARLHGAEPQVIAEAQQVFDPNLLTIGFARRFATYKRPTLMLRDPERLRRLITSKEHPLQIIVAGKAHPGDDEAKKLIAHWTEFARDPAVRGRVVFLEDYDMVLAQGLVRGVDVWLNTPRRPLEACGTSGMKVLANGGLNLSELDGWWAEAYTPEVGWALGDARPHPDEDWDAAEAVQLYDILENTLVPEFYDRDPTGIPVKWVARVRSSMARLTPMFSANRMLRDYVEQIYVPATASYRQRSAEGGKLAGALNDWQYHIARFWSDIHFGPVRVDKSNQDWVFSVPVYLGELEASAVQVELYAEARDSYGPALVVLGKGDKLLGATNGWVYTGRVNAERPAEHYTPRIIPHHPSARVPMEDPHITWQR
jgi:starch phosphorylase